MKEGNYAMGETGYYSLERGTSNREFLQKKLHVNCVGSSYYANAISVPQYRYDYYLIYIQAGHATITTPDIKVTLEKGDMIILPPFVNSLFESAKDKPIDYMWLHFTGYKTADLFNKVNIECNKVYKIGIHSVFNKEWKRLYSEFATNDRFFDELSVSILNSILISFSRYIHKTPLPATLKSISYIHENLYTDLRISQLAKIEGFCTNRYRDLFYKVVGMSPLDYIITKRIEAAKVHLNNTNVSIAEISKSVGYNDAYYFSRIFRKKVGMSPAQYRKTTSYNHQSDTLITKGNITLTEKKHQQSV